MDLGIDFDKDVKKGKSQEIPRKEPVGQGSKLERKLSPPKLFKCQALAKDPVKEDAYHEELEKLMEQIMFEEATKPKKPKEATIDPDTKTRVELERKPSPVFPRTPYVVPETKKQKQAKLDRRRQAEIDRNFCQWKQLTLDKPPEAVTMSRPVDVPSPDVSLSQVKVVPRKPTPSPSQGMPDSPVPSQLELHKPKSGVLVNEIDPVPPKVCADSFDLVNQRKPRVKLVRHRDEAKEERELLQKLIQAQNEPKPVPAVQTLEEQLILESQQMADEDEGEEPDHEEVLLKLFRRKVSQVSKATSLNSKELTGLPDYEELDLEAEPHLNRLVQKFRRDSEAQRYKSPPRRIKRGTLESHSFTKIAQPTLKELHFGQVMGSIHQGNEHFGPTTRGKQGICMPVAAYCYAMIVHPDEWTDLVVDDILDIGSELMMDSLAKLHMHKDHKELEYHELAKYCRVGDKKIRFQVYEPEIVGLTRSADKRIYNLAKGLKLFFNRHRCGILKTIDTHVAIWKVEEHYFFYDAKGRKKNMEPSDDEGKAVLAYLYDIPDICTVYLSKSNLGNSPYTISKLSVLKILDKDALEEDDREVHKEQSDYNVVDDNRAVVQGSFDLGDLCFDFARNKQAIAMAAVCLVYSRITPPSAWHRKTIDKIMVIGNQLYMELVESEHIAQMSLDNLPASFTIGPYFVEIVVYSNLYADCMVRKSQSMFHKLLEKFLEANSMAIAFIGKSAVAVWKQRNVYYCFDPYSRNHEGLKCRNGSSCVSMNANLETLTSLVGQNFDNPDEIFYLHALKVLKIHRDPVQAEFFPKTLTMEDIPADTFKCYQMRKSKKKATHKAVTADFDQTAVRTLLAGDFLGRSIIEIGSGVESLAPHQVPAMVTKFPSRAMIRALLPETEKPIDLDSPSLSDTQIEPDRPEPVKGDEAIDMSSWELTQDELELQGGGEGEGEGEGPLESYTASSKYAQVHAESLQSYKSRISAEVNTDISVGFLPIPREVLNPTNIYAKQMVKMEMMMSKKKKELRMIGELTEPEVTQAEELAKPSNFTDLPDNTQIIRGATNIATYGQDLEFVAPFACMMAAAVAQKYSVTSWSPEVIDYVLRSGARLYKVSKIRYDQVPILEVPKVSLGQSSYSILVEYLFDGYLRQKILEVSIEKILFKKHFCGIIVTPSYACAIFYKNHLYYMLDCFGCNEVGLGEGPSNEGAACFFRFKSIRDLVTRILYNKSKRDVIEEFEYSRFVLSACTSKLVPRKMEKVPMKDKKSQKAMLVEYGEGEIPPEQTTEVEEEEKPPRPKNKVGYQFNGTKQILTLQGSTALKGRLKISYDELKADHFVCICAILMLLCIPVLKWDTKRVDYVLAQGKHIFLHAENLEVSEKRTIRNILIHKHFFDIIITRIRITSWYKNRIFEVGLDTVLKKHNYVLIQFPNTSYVIYQHGGYYHVFDPYATLGDDGAMDESEAGAAGWTLFVSLKAAKRRIKSQIIKDAEHYMFYTFEVTSVREAPKKMVLSQRLMEYEFDQKVRPEVMGKPFNEKIDWIKKETVPWSRMKLHNATGQERGQKGNLWHNWDVEYPGDLYSLLGTLHQNSETFNETIRGKQTLANLVVCIGMLSVYELSEWTPAIMDSILINGATYFKESITLIQDEDYELGVEDLKTDCTVAPFQFEVCFTPIVMGTMFVMRSTQFNLYKGLRYFLDNYENRCGLIFCTKGNEDEEQKRVVAFGKVKEREYFMYDCQALGPPMFLDCQGVAYIMRCRSLKRLLHVLALTLRGGDFYIFEVDVDNFKPVEEDKE